MAGKLTNRQITGTDAPEEGDLTIPIEQAAAPDSPLQSDPGHKAPANPTYVVVADVISWREPIEGTSPAKFKYRRLFRGRGLPDTVPAEEIARLSAAAAIATPAQAREIMSRRITGHPIPPGEVYDKELTAMDELTLIAYLVQFPSEAVRVHRIETSRVGGARASVLTAAGYDPETGEPLA